MGLEPASALLREARRYRSWIALSTCIETWHEKIALSHEIYPQCTAIEMRSEKDTMVYHATGSEQVVWVNDLVTRRPRE